MQSGHACHNEWERIIRSPFAVSYVMRQICLSQYINCEVCFTLVLGKRLRYMFMPMCSVVCACFACRVFPAWRAVSWRPYVMPIYLRDPFPEPAYVTYPMRCLRDSYQDLFTISICVIFMQRTRRYDTIKWPCICWRTTVYVPLTTMQLVTCAISYIPLTLAIIRHSVVWSQTVNIVLSL